MGQAHPRSIDLEASMSTGPDPTLFHPASASTPMQATGADQTFSRIDYTPGGSLPPSNTNTGSRGKGLVRKISQKARCRNHAKTKTSIEAFEQLVLKKEAKAGILPADKEARIGLLPFEKDPLACESPTFKTAKAGTFAATRAKRASISDGSSSAFIPFPAGGSTSTPLPFRPTATANIPRRDSGRISIKSARRAEREWRAKVAALGHTANSPRSGSVVEIRGPVPPRRKAPVHRPVSPLSVPQPISPASLPQLASPTSVVQPASPASDFILTPHVSPATTTDIAETTTARSFISDMSFGTLGHGADTTTTPTRLEDGPRSRKVSVPQSVTSFYFDSYSRGGTRPSSFATILTLTPIPQGSGDITGTSPRDRKISLPPFDSFLASPANVANSPGNSPISVSRAIEDTDENASGSRYRPNIQPIVPTPFKLAGDQVSSPTLYSPVTAYLLTAPIDKLSLDGSNTSGTPRYPEHERHPFADASLALPHHTPQPPTPPPKPPITTICQRHGVTRTACARHHSDTSYDPFTATPPRTTSRSRAKAMHTDSLPVALRAGKVLAKSQVVGSRPPRVKVDLTPGMETGNRPPKSGMGVGDLERWLQQTTLTS